MGALLLLLTVGAVPCEIAHDNQRAITLRGDHALHGLAGIGM
jgi:hypothetical protein